MNTNDFFSVTPYSREALITCVCDETARKHQVSAKSHLNYLHKYLEHIEAATILVEYHYTDRDYLEDFASYYIRCFTEYGRRCRRLHFFSSEFTSSDFVGLLNGRGQLDQKTLQAAYLGFIVLKPLPLTVVGRTCLATYANKTGRHFPAGRAYNVNLFGVELKTKRTIAFQEQDRVVAACATSALWSAFHATSVLFDHQVPSPVEITRAATENFPTEHRSFPSVGLTSPMMARAIRTLSLEPFLVSAIDANILKSTLYAYLRAGIPTVLGIDLYRTKAPHEHLGKHAVVVAGYNIEQDGPVADPIDNFQLKAFRIDKIFVHDDQVGPFAKMGFVHKCVPDYRTGELVEALSTSWSSSGADADSTSALAVPDILLAPLYHKIRIPFEAVSDAVRGFDTILSLVISKQKHEDVSFEWDIYLTTVNKLKTRVFSNRESVADTNLVTRTLLQTMPRYLWRATCYSGDDPVLDLLFDATDIEQGNYFIRCNTCDSEIQTILQEYGRSPAVQELLSGRREWEILSWFLV